MRFLAIAAVLGIAPPVHAGGMVLPVRGVRDLARAGAEVAGADDADALWLDPAGLANLAGDGKKGFLFDVAYVYQAIDYARIDSTGKALPSISNQQPGTPIPTIAGSLGIGDRLVIAGGITAPYAGLHRYDDTGPQRYASISLAGSTFVVVTIGAAYRLTDRLRVGATLQDLVSHVSSRIALSACVRQCAAEDPAFDSVAQLDQSDYVAPSGSLGVQYDARPGLTIGATLQAPTRVGAGGDFTVKVPAAFTGASVVGDQAHLNFTLPPTARFGVEYRRGAWRAELALDIELWGFQDSWQIVNNVQFANVPGIGSAALGTLTIPRDYHASYAPALGVEWRGGDAMIGAGYSYETSAAPAGDVSALTVDAGKHIVGLGGGYDAEGWQIGAAVGFVQLADVDVALADARVSQLAPFNPTAPAINAGTYRSRYLLAGLRFARRF